MHVLNNKPSKMRSETRERVLRAVRELDYRPAPRHRHRLTEQINTIGVASGLATDPSEAYSYYNFVLHGILAGIFRARQNVTLFTHPMLWSNTPLAIRTFCDGRCDGLLLIAPGSDSPLSRALWERGFPCVVVGDTPDGHSCIDVDNAAAAREVVTYLLGQGHRRVGLLQGPANHSAVLLRTQGYWEALAAGGLPANPALILAGDYTAESGYACAEALLNRPAGERPTALFCYNDAIAFGAWQAARDRSIRVPEDLSLVGFDDGPQSLQTVPPLTTVRQPYLRIGERAVEMLLAGVKGEAKAVVRELLPTELALRGSVGPPGRG